MAQDKVCLGIIVGVHGVRGLVRVKSFTDRPEDVAAYGPLTDEAGRQRLALSVKGHAKGVLLAAIEGVDTRDRAEALRGTKLCVARSALPEIGEAEVYYHADLIGLAVEDEAGSGLGRVKAVHNYGAGDLLEVVDEAAPGASRRAGPSMLIPFTREAVPKVHLHEGRMVVRPPAADEATPEPVGGLRDEP